MSSNKLKLKRTPEEEAQRRIRKEVKRKQKRKREHYEESHEKSPSSKRAHGKDGLDEVAGQKWASSDEDVPSVSDTKTKRQPSSSDIDYDALRAEIEERTFREKMFDAMHNDEFERLDSIEAHFNDFAHVPDRWRSPTGTSTRRTFNPFEGDDLLKLDPSTMDDEEYVEWIRAGMYRKNHADEYAKKQRAKAAKEAKRAEEKARKAETARLEGEAELERKRRKTEKAMQKLEHAREEYHLRWLGLLSPPTDGGDVSLDGLRELTFDDIPWPVVAAYRRRLDRASGKGSIIDLTELTSEAISSFLLELGEKKTRKEKLRETYLRYHPDKFEGRFMKRIREEEREKVREGISQVSRVLNSMMLNK